MIQRRVHRVLTSSAFLLWAAGFLGAVEAAPKPASAVPAWDARGIGPLPAQGISCIDLSDDARWLAVGTIAAPGEPNVLLFDAQGQLVRTVQVGQRWIQQVAIDRTGQLLHALCTMPEGRAGDFPTVFACGQTPTPIPPQLGENGWPLNLLHYGEHSNHTGVILRGTPQGGVAVYGNRVHWLRTAEGLSQFQVGLPRPDEAVTVSMIADRHGHVLVGCAAGRAGDGGKPEANLFLLRAKTRAPLWSRPVLVETDKAAPFARGRYGAPTLPDGQRQEVPQRDVEVFAPLSLAMHGEEQPERLAVADYPGWQRWVRSSATSREQNYGVRFPPARPMVTVHDGRGQVIRRFGPEQFAHPGWVDLCFVGGGRYLLAYPHHWTSRGLAGQSILPADEEARMLHILDVNTGKVRRLEFPDAISDVAASDMGPTAVGCWNGKVYLLGLDRLTEGSLPPGLEVGGPSLVRVSRDGSQVVVATTKGVLRLLDRDGKERWRRELDQLVKPALKPWVANARATPIGPGVWQLPGGRVESDLGGQRVVEAPDGLILIEGHAGLSFEREWASMKAVGLDPTRVKYVLATHEHGDHAPGAYLWRVVTGARFVCSEEMADSLQHHVPLGTGYGLHPPVPTDIRIAQDTDLDLAGLKVRALRLPGHTAGSMGWFFTRADRKYVAFGDLIMPDGPLGFSGSINFSARDVLSSLRKLRDLRPDVALPGHGPTGDPTRYIEAGIAVGVHVGWGMMRPEKPDPSFRLTQKNVQAAAWNIGIAAADCGDLDGDGRPDIAVAVNDRNGTSVQLFLNRKGSFPAEPDHRLHLPGVTAVNKVRIRHLNDDRQADMLVSGQGAALLLATGKLPNYQVVSLPASDVQQAYLADLQGKGPSQIAVGTRFGGWHVVEEVRDGRARTQPMRPEVRWPYADFRIVDLNGDGRPDLISSYGKVYLRQADGKLPPSPTLQLPLPEEKDWTFLGVGDFDADGRPDVALLSYGMQQRQPLAVFANTGNANRPFAEKPSMTLDLAGPEPKRGQPPLLRDAPVVADWNGDGFADLIIGKGQDSHVRILLGSKEGLSPRRSATIALDYRIHYETGLHVADFDGDGVPDLACLGYTNTGVGSGGPLAVYIWIQPRR